MTWKAQLTSAIATLALAGALPITSTAQPEQAPTSTRAKQASAAKSRLVEHVAQGSVVTMTDTSMIVRFKKGKDLTLALNSDTEKIGEIGNGKQVTVHYRNERGQHVATSIQQTAAVQNAAAAKSKNN
jgi:hypothetical protein